jgi:superfamily II DNA or RNA helicase
MNPPALRWDDARPWRFVIDIKLADPSARRWTWRGALRRDDDRMDLAEPLVLLPGMLIQGVGRAARFDDGGVFLWMARLRHEKEMSLSESQQDTMLGRILGESRVPSTELVDGLELYEVDVPPTPCLVVRAPMQARGTDMLIADLEFDYDGARVASFPAVRMAVQTSRRRAIRRDARVETKAKERLADLGFRPIQDFRFDPGTMEVSPKRVPQAARELVAEGWRVEADGILYRSASDFKLDVTSGMDWFELDGRVSFGSQDVALPQILEAARRGDTMIALGDGSIGMLPDDWLKKYGLLVDLGTATDEGRLRFHKTQAGLLDAMLAEQGESRADADFTKVREELRAFEGIKPIDAPPGFQGELRPYQCEGLGWLEYLRRFEFGGILADDMGLGKTVQVLALMQRRRAKKQADAASLIVVPRSLVFNWIQEAAKFTPRLKLLDYTGPNRHALREKFDKYDLIVTTYGTLRSDAAELCNYEFDYAILDEAQSIKNADSQSAKAARLLRAKHRLAMSGTPIENHLGELWSIFEFLNPGMLGTASVFKRAAGGIGGQDEEGRKLLAKALRPFILRRTKRQVVSDLPEKIEQTLYCDLEAGQRKLYDELLEHYRKTLLRKDAEELRTSKIEVLEALLRLRQAACHPGLIDPARSIEPSAKLDMLLPQLAEVVDEGHKVLVFSQFTSFLSIVRQRLDEEKLTYEYLDGRTRNRQERVDRFQTDPNCPIFLISLKAGGLGLNLTAAEYVYLLDPWWNPAVEAQAIDRSHRIGQINNVFAYRLICRDTVEQKILDLQQKKRDLADAILNADNRLIQGLTRDDLEFLLS